MEKKKCSRCKAEKPVADFGLSRGKPWQYCKVCARAISTSYRKTHYAKVREIEKRSRLKQEFGLSPDELVNFIASRNGCCDICGKNTPQPHLDHCHTEKRIRGLLCLQCNLGIGCFADDPDLIRAAIVYLNHYASGSS